MALSRWVSSLAASLALGGLGCEPPLELQVLSESTRQARDRPSPRASAVFDGAIVRLRGARGETLGVELRISDGRLREAELSFPSAAANVTASSVCALAAR